MGGAISIMRQDLAELAADHALHNDTSLTPRRRPLSGL
jgi:hypothetical protein